MKSAKARKKHSSPDQYVRNILKRAGPLKAVNFYKYFGHTNQAAADDQLRSSLENIAAEGRGKIPVAALHILGQWKTVIGSAAVRQYWAECERKATKAEQRTHRHIMADQAARQQRALGEALTRDIENQTEVLLSATEKNVKSETTEISHSKRAGRSFSHLREQSPIH
ncbi:hypothetical protein BC832DRAFT_553789 [Gaertneriomyces semiglobifer]|nr:hypothetical protein BC832DRAFT_553789 [Gaertneriomyces semiglobifer]